MDTTTAEQRSWQQSAGQDGMAHMPGELDDLSNIFDIGDFDLDSIPNVDSTSNADHLHNAQNAAHQTSNYLDSMPHASPNPNNHDFADHDPSFSIPNQSIPTTIAYSNGSMYQQHYPNAHQQSFQVGMQQHNYTPANHIPPTPNSFEMHGETGRFLQQQMEQQRQRQQQAIFMQQQQQQHMQKLEQQQQHHHQAQFTPMASPNSTPQYAVQPEFTTPGAYFSPLTSPALHAQIPQQSAQHHLVQQQTPGYFTNPSTAPNSNAPSPVDLNTDVEMLDSLNPLESAGKRTTRKKMVTPRSVGPTSNRPRQSPIQKPQKRKSGLLSSIVPAKDLDKMFADSQASNKTAASHAISNALDSSESGSISPEPLSEALMRPPPRPASLTQSPSLSAQPNAHHRSMPFNKAAAATPKSILSMRSQHSEAANNDNIDPAITTPTNASMVASQAVFEDLQLPEAADKQPQSRRPSLTKLDVSGADSTRASTRKTPKLGPTSTPASARPLSASASPGTAFSPMTAGTPGAFLKDKKSDGKNARPAKKRGSTGASNSAVASPALRPRISPSIKPLLPEGSALHSPTHALLLASKSNYQNLLEGNHLPGVNYPDSLSTGLTSKRTSHKVAEQGRRNRINEALKEMQMLIPTHGTSKSNSDEAGIVKEEEEDSPEANGEADAKDGKETSSAKSNSSKAATVESANRYIRLLKESDASQKAAILALKQENDEIRRKLAQATGSVSHTTAMPDIDEFTADG